MTADERVGTDARARMAAELALLGGRLALERFHLVQVSVKRSHDPAASARLAIQDALGREIARAFPDDGLVGDAIGRPRRARYAWVLGAVDGAGNFARGLAGFSVSIGVVRDGLPFAGAVYDPVARWLFVGCVGRGAWLNDRPLRVGGTSPDESSLVAIRTPCRQGVPEHVESWLRRHRVRHYGSTALHLCYVALGGLDFVHDERASLWDVAGAAPVLLEAGGVLTTEHGAAVFPVSADQAAGVRMSVLAGHPAAHADAIRDIAGQPAPLAPAAR